MSCLDSIKLSAAPYLHPSVELRDSKLGAYVYVGANSILSKSSIGSYSHVGTGNDIFASEIGKFASLASEVRINPVQHPTYDRIVQSHITYRRALYGFGKDDAEFFAWRESRRTLIGHDVWVGYNVTIQGNLTIGNGAVVGSMAVVTKDVEPYTIVVGNPARAIKARFDDRTIECIEKSAWWNWSHEQLHERLTEFNNREAFCEKYGQ